MHLRQPRQRRQAYKSGTVFKVGPATVRYSIIGLVAVLSVFYLIQVAQGSDLGIELRDLRNQKDSLNKELSTIKINESRILSLQKLEESASLQGLVPVGSDVEVINLDEDE